MDPRMMGSRVRGPGERPREYNDPSKQHEFDHFYDRSAWPDRIKTAVGVAVVLAIVALVVFIVFNIVFG